MPDDAVLRGVYSADYLSVNQSADVPGSPKDHAWVIHELRRRRSGIFVDYGCGAGDLLQKAARAGWRVHGVELNQDVAERVESNTGLPVTTRPESLLRGGGAALADVIHIGDVMEHFGHLDSDLDRALALLKPGGLLMVQGPLVSGACLFNWFYQTAGRLRPERIIEAAPTHLVASTRTGVETLVERRRLQLVEFRLTEVTWPGPWRWEANPKSMALFALRRISQQMSRLAPRHLGNRYRFSALKPV